MPRLPILGRKSFRTYVFLVVFVCTLTAFTPAPTSIGTAPFKAHKSQRLFGYKPNPAAEPPAPHLEYHVHTDTEPAPSTPEQPLVPPPRPTHTFRPDGLLQVNPDARHPILDLIDRAEHDWNAKLARASRTLPDAVHEYHRRYNRAPPPGFDKWRVLPIVSITISFPRRPCHAKMFLILSKSGVKF